MFGKSKISQSMIDAVNGVLGEKIEGAVVQNVLLDEAAEKVATPTGMKVYGSSYGNSAKARKDQTKSPVDDLKGPKDKEVKEEDEMTFAKKLMDKIVSEKKDLVMPEATTPTSPVKNQDVADKSYLKNKPGVKSDLKNLGRFLTGKKETNEAVEELDEKHMTDADKTEQERIVKGMKKNLSGFKSRYGARAKDVMYATATKQAMKEDAVEEATIAGTPGWKEMKKDVKDKSGAVHTPMSRARDLARSAFNKVKDKTKID